MRSSPGREASWPRAPLGWCVLSAFKSERIDANIEYTFQFSPTLLLLPLPLLHPTPLSSLSLVRRHDRIRRRERHAAAHAIGRSERHAATHAVGQLGCLVGFCGGEVVSGT